MSKESHISIFVKDMRVQVRIGLYPHEREGPQPLDVSVELFTDMSYLRGADKDKIIDYSRIHKGIKAWEQADHVDLMESCLQKLLDMAFEFEAVSAVEASISKPEIFEETDQAGLAVYMRREDYENNA